jgi:preprotein translocase subunit SecF
VSARSTIGRLYRGETTTDFVGRRKLWFTISVFIIVAGIVSLGVRGLNLGIDFKGGTYWESTFTGAAPSTATINSAVTQAGISNPTIYILGGKTIHVEANTNSFTGSQLQNVVDKVVTAIENVTHTKNVTTNSIGPTWGSQVTGRALWALLAFFFAVVIYISFRFEPKMALAAFVAMVHDLLVTLGVYSIFNLQITPDTVIAILTILGYSLYDTVVVFDRVRDNTHGILKSGDLTYSDMVNLSMNQTLARSINTSLVAILPVLSVLLVGAEILGATTLQNYGLALFVGLVSGAYSSIFISSPILAILKEREPRFKDLAARLATRSERVTYSAAQAAALLGSSGPAARASAQGGTITARGRKKKRR